MTALNKPEDFILASVTVDLSASDGQAGGEATAPRYVREPFEREPHFAGTSVNYELAIAAFLNVAIGQLFGEFTEDEIRARLSVTDITQSDLALVKRVVDNAKLHFHRPREGASAPARQVLACHSPHADQAQASSDAFETMPVVEFDEQ